DGKPLLQATANHVPIEVNPDSSYPLLPHQLQEFAAAAGNVEHIFAILKEGEIKALPTLDLCFRSTKIFFERKVIHFQFRSARRSRSRLSRHRLWDSRPW